MEGLQQKAAGIQLESTEIAPEVSESTAPVIMGLSAHLESLWCDAKQAKESITERLLSCARQRRGEYEPKKLAEIKETGGSEIYMMLTSVKCRAASAWLRDIMMPDDENAWMIQPTPIPKLSREVQQQVRSIVEGEFQRIAVEGGQAPNNEDFQARLAEVKQELMERLKEMAAEACGKMSVRIEDQLSEGKWRKQLRGFIDDLVTFPTAFFEGPVLRRRNRLSWGVNRSEGDDKVSYEPSVEDEVVLEFERISPYDVYPAPDCNDDLQDSYLFLRKKIRASKLESYRRIDGFSERAINQVLNRYGDSGYREWVPHDEERARLESRDRENYSERGKIDMLQFFGEVSGKMLRAWGMSDKKVPDPNHFYSVECWKIGAYVIKAIINPHPLGQHSVHATSFDKLPGSIWGIALPEMMRDDQGMCNAAARALSNNMGLASGPMVSYNDTSRVPPGESLTHIYPWKIFQFEKDGMATTHRPPITFYQPSMHSRELLAIFEHFSRKAGEHTNLPDYSYGEVAGNQGALATASGMSMALGNASKTIKQTVANIDLDVIEPAITNVYIHNMRYDDDDSIKGDAQIKARGARSLVVKEQQLMKQGQFLATALNPIDSEILGKPGRAKLLKAHMKSLGLPDDIIPDMDTAKIDPARAMQTIQELEQELQRVSDPLAKEELRGQIDLQKAQIQAGTADKDRELKRDIAIHQAVTTNQGAQTRLSAGVDLNRAA